MSSGKERVGSRLIGLSGRAFSGKDTTADYIGEWCAEQNITFAKRAFATPLKVSAAHALGVFDNEIEFCNELKQEGSWIQVRHTTPHSGPNTPLQKLTGREYLQYYGTEAHREVFGYNFWVDALLPADSAYPGEEPWRKNFTWEAEDQSCGGWADVCVVTDVRFDNEAQRINDLGGEVWEILRDTKGSSSHASETPLMGEYIDMTIDNNSTIDQLKESVFSAMSGVVYA